uniref:Uncharacterized protein n=1 Tax=Arundo donax TaxID=35708 RepID=A0A0A9FA60_ARUDO
MTLPRKLNEQLPGLALQAGLYKRSSTETNTYTYISLNILTSN